MKLKLDLHVHTTNSKDAYTRPDQIPILCREAGLDGLAITDHNALPATIPEGVIFIPGIEVSSKQGHVIGLGLSESVPLGLSADETILEIRKLGGVTIIPHPYDLLRPSVRPDALSSRPDAIEVINSASFLHSITWKRATKFASRNDIPGVAGSDSHIPETLGRAFTIIETDSIEISSVLDAIRNGRVRAEGRPIHLGDRFHKLILHR